MDRILTILSLPVHFLKLILYIHIVAGWSQDQCCPWTPMERLLWAPNGVWEDNSTSIPCYLFQSINFLGKNKRSASMLAEPHPKLNSLSLFSLLVRCGSQIGPTQLASPPEIFINWPIFKFISLVKRWTPNNLTIIFMKNKYDFFVFLIIYLVERKDGRTPG